MFIKPVEKPIILEKERVLLDWLPKNHEKRAKVEEDFAMKSSGYYGEKNTAYFLSFLQKDNYQIFHNLRFCHSTFPKKRYFQMDFVLNSKSFITIIEVKNYTGEITIDTTFNQLTRRHKGKVERLDNPLDQVLRQRFHFNDFLNNHHFSSVPIEYLVVFSHPNCILRTDNKDHPMTKRFLLAEDLPNKMEELRAKYNERALDPTQLSALHKTYLKENTPDDCDILEKFNIQPDKLLKGIQCEQCGFLPMKRIKGMWCCPICPWVSDVAHYQKLYGFSLIIKNTISTSEACQLFMFNHPQQVRKMLQKMNLTPVGERKSRIYLLNSGVLKNIKFLKK